MENEFINKETGAKFIFAASIAFFMEFFGTSMLVYSINMSSTPMGIALTLMGVIVATGPVSGAHVNPGVTTAYFIMNMSLLNLAWLCFYWVAEVCGGMFGAYLAMISL
jgi:glycerol uptake facilitator-like aquaporin